MSKSNDLRLSTERLISYMDNVAEKFQEVKQTGVKGDFFLEVKPFADEVKQVNDQWLKAAAVWVEDTRPKNLYVKQIQSTYDQIEMLSVQTFYPETSNARFKNYLQSVQFILKTVFEKL